MRRLYVCVARRRLGLLWMWHCEHTALSQFNKCCCTKETRLPRLFEKAQSLVEASVCICVCAAVWFFKHVYIYICDVHWNLKPCFVKGYPRHSSRMCVYLCTHKCVSVCTLAICLGKLCWVKRESEQSQFSSFSLLALWVFSTKPAIHLAQWFFTFDPRPLPNPAPCVLYRAVRGSYLW